MIYQGDLFDVLPTLDPESIDACVTDPPYGIGFMGKEWDSFLPSVAAKKAGLRQYGKLPRWKENNPNLKGRTVNGAISASQIEYDRTLEGQRAFQDWTARWAAEVFRVLKPGAHIVVCGAPRSFHRMTCGLEDAGFEIRDCLSWLYGQGFPKSLNLGDGRGTALKPSWEPCVLGRKPFKGSVTANLATHGTGALNVDACRIAGEPWEAHYGDGLAKEKFFTKGERTQYFKEPHDRGRWPANVLLDEDAAQLLDEMTGELMSGGTPASRSPDQTYRNALGGFRGTPVVEDRRDPDMGGASRFYKVVAQDCILCEASPGSLGSASDQQRFLYSAKPSRAERDYGCEGLAVRSGGDCTDREDGSAGLNSPRAGAGRTGRAASGGSRNFHPT